MNRVDRHDQSRTISTYSWLWNRHRVIRPEEDRATFFNRTGLKPSELPGKRVLDAGCGMGRYALVAAEAGAKVVGIDLSESVRAACELTSPHGSAHFIRGDILKPPFADGPFDHIYALGVIDHAPDPRTAFLRLARLLKPGGRIVVWVYQRERPSLEWVIRTQRGLSTRMPLGMIAALARLTSPIGGLKRRLMTSSNRLLIRLGVLLNVLTIGVSMHPDPEVRVCDTFDWYAPKFQSRHTFDEVSGWFRDAGLVDVVDLSRNQTFYHSGIGRGVNLAGNRPAN